MATFCKFVVKLSLICIVVLGCTDDSDCNYLGKCDISSICLCNEGWFGEKCDFINVTSEINYNIDGYHDPTGLNTWDGSPIQDSKTSLWHLYITILTELCSVNTWLSNSIIAHLVSSTSNPIGPYTYSDIALGPYNNTNDISSHWDGLSVYTPIVIKDINPNKELYYLFYVGTTATDAIHINCSISPGGMNSTLQYNQQIGYATSKSLYGPWIRSSSNPIISPRGYNKSLWDSGYVCNPYPSYLSNGSMVLIYKGRSLNDNNGMKTGMAMILNSSNDSWNGEYIRYDTYFNDDGDCEDGFFWESQNNGPSGLSVYHIEYHCKCNGLHAYSLDLMNWIYNEQQYWCNITFTNGTIMQLSRRERPAIIFKDKYQQNATFIFSAVQPQTIQAFNLVQQL